MLLPPLFPLFIRDFGFSYAELGLLVSSFFVVSGIGQASSGFLVDRVGARPVLFAALGCFIAVGAGGGQRPRAMPGWCWRPCWPDSAMRRSIRSTSRSSTSACRSLGSGHAFSVHGISGNLGWAAAPVFLTGHHRGHAAHGG